MVKKYTRKELYELVWEKPRSKLASEVGVSSVAIAKACRKYQIPMPDRSYWAKLAAGKPVRKRPLPSRLPGVPEIVQLRNPWRYGYHDDASPGSIPVAPTFEEDIENVRETIARRVGSVPFPRVGTNAHWLTRRLLERDNERRDAKGYLWRKPIFEVEPAKRKLRIMNAIFLALQKAGCEPSVSLAVGDDCVDAFHATVGEQHVSFTWLDQPKGRPSNKNPDSDARLTLVLGKRHSKQAAKTWQDAPDVPLESHLSEIVVSTITQGEINYRDGLIWRYEWRIQRIAEEEEKARKKAAEEERLAKELEERRQKQLLQGLLDDAASLEKARTIREFVAKIQARKRELNVAAEDVDKWVAWALSQADRIDPLVTLNFLDRALEAAD